MAVLQFGNTVKGLLHVSKKQRSLFLRPILCRGPLKNRVLLDGVHRQSNNSTVWLVTQVCADYL